MRALRIALAGYGYWGPNIARNLALLPDAELVAVCDADPERLAEAARVFPGATGTGSFAEVCADSEIDAIVIATPADTHGDLAEAALRAGKHVLVEKPLADSAERCRALGALARDRGLTLMAGHTFLYHAAVRRLREYIASGDLGRVLYVSTQRLNLGRLRRDVNVVWNLAPHDISILLYVLGEDPVAVTAHGRCFIQPDVEDVAFLTLEFSGDRFAHVHVSWLDPRKVRKVTVVGTDKMVIYDDVDVEARLQVYDKGIDVVPDPEAPGPDGEGGRRHENWGEFQTLVRSGDLLVPKVDFEEPLRVQSQEFVDAIRDTRPPLTDAEHAAQVVAVLEAADASLMKSGERVLVAR